MDFDTTTGAFTVRELAGGDYKLRVVAGATGEGDAVRESFEFDPAEVIAVTAGQSISIDLQFDETAQTYTLTGGGASGVATTYTNKIN